MQWIKLSAAMMILSAATQANAGLFDCCKKDPVCCAPSPPLLRRSTDLLCPGSDALPCRSELLCPGRDLLRRPPREPLRPGV
jgi:hypothetical protein